MANGRVAAEEVFATVTVRVWPGMDARMLIRSIDQEFKAARIALGDAAFELLRGGDD